MVSKVPDGTPKNGFVNALNMFPSHPRRLLQDLFGSGTSLRISPHPGLPMQMLMA